MAYWVIELGNDKMYWIWYNNLQYFGYSKSALADFFMGKNIFFKGGELYGPDSKTTM